MKCVICKKEIDAKRNSVVCDEKCKNIRLKLLNLVTKYFPTNGCDNCWGDL